MNEQSDLINLPCVLNLNQLECIILESFDVAFTLCNTNFTKYGPDKIVDVMNQIIPTAVVLKTAYWPFYATINGRPLCMCERFFIECDHKNNFQHWINMKPIEESSFYFKDDVMLHVKPKQIAMEIIQEDAQEIIISTNFNVSLFNLFTLIERQTSTRTFIKLHLRVIIGLFPLMDTAVLFIPHPAQLPQHGQSVNKLKDQYKYMHINLYKPLYVTPSTLCVDVQSLCKLFTTIICNVRVFKRVDHTRKSFPVRNLLSSDYDCKYYTKFDEIFDIDRTYHVKEQYQNRISNIYEDFTFNTDFKERQQQQQQQQQKHRYRQEKHHHHYKEQKQQYEQQQGDRIKIESGFNLGTNERYDTFIKPQNIENNLRKIWENDKGNNNSFYTVPSKSPESHVSTVVQTTKVVRWQAWLIEKIRLG